MSARLMMLVVRKCERCNDEHIAVPASPYLCGRCVRTLIRTRKMERIKANMRWLDWAAEQSEKQA